MENNDIVNSRENISIKDIDLDTNFDKLKNLMLVELQVW